MFNSNLIDRIFGIFFLLPIFFFVFYGNQYFYFIIFLISSLIAFEYSSIILGSNKNNFKIILCSFFLVSPFILDLFHISSIYIYFTPFLVIFFLKEYFFTIILIVFINSTLIITTFKNGNFLLIFISIIIISSDVGAYIFGKFFGGKKLAVKISPSKTWAGFFGSILFSVCISIMIFLYLQINIILSVFLGLFISILSQLGDLLESVLKRKYNFKDSSSIIPGHGGFLDRFDGYLLVLPISVMAFYFLM